MDKSSEVCTETTSHHRAVQTQGLGRSGLVALSGILDCVLKSPPLEECDHAWRALSSDSLWQKLITLTFWKHSQITVISPPALTIIVCTVCSSHKLIGIAHFILVCILWLWKSDYTFMTAWLKFYYTTVTQLSKPHFKSTSQSAVSFIHIWPQVTSTLWWTERKLNSDLQIH